ncbi:MAG: hypothetical protein A2X79_00225 [Desulfuromonadaceae bacterium GWB2_53_15]|nr:MAG: hypothetical protein A2X79_00225 [Desulfuromonadaceae bacterium GWB2_53_15]
MEHQASVEEYGYKQELKRSLGVRDLVIFGIIFMSPASCMTLFGLMTTISQGHNVIAYAIGFIAMLFTAYSYGKMVEAFPIAGSAYSYTQRAVSPKLGFIAGWVMLMDYFLIPLLLYVISSIYAHEMIPQIPLWGWILIYVIPVSYINIRGVEVAAKTNTVVSALLIAALLAFVIAAIHYAVTGTGVSLFSMNAIYNPKMFSMKAVISASVLAVLSYLGFDSITTLAEEVHDSAKKIKLAIFIALTLQSVLYFSLSYFATVVAPDFTTITNPDTAFFELTYKVGGSALQIFITLVIIISGASTALAGQAAASRLLYGMGRDKLIPGAFFAYLHPTYRTPTYSILFMAVAGIAGALTISFATLADLVAFGGLFGFICVNLSVIFHYYIKCKSGKIVRHVIFPLLGMIICAYILYGMSTLAKTVGFSWMGVGIIYLVVRSFASQNFKDLLENNSLVNPDAICALDD